VRLKVPSLLVVNVLEALLFAQMTLLVFFVQVFLKSVVVKEVLLAKPAFRMKRNQVVFRIESSFGQMEIHFVRCEGLVLVHQKDFVLDAQITKELRVVPRQMLLVVVHAFEILLALALAFRAPEFAEENESA
jgi:hypothetical protein